MNLNKIFLGTLLIIAFHFCAIAQASWEKFGQNRVQIRTFDWKYFDSTHFRTFYYDKGNAHALYALNTAEQELSHIVYMMGGSLNRKLNIVIYNNYNDFCQTNIGRKSEALNLANGGSINVVGDNIPIYFNGDHFHMRRQIVKGIASVIKDNMLFGDNFKDVVKNAIKMNLPEWFTYGYISFISEDWTSENSAQLKSLFLSQKKGNIIDIATMHPSFTGHSFWNYIESQYGENYISNILYLTRYRKSVSNALESVLQKPFKTFIIDWQNYYHLTPTLDTIQNKASKELPPIEIQNKLLTKIKLNSNAHYSNISFSPSGKFLAFVEKKEGEFFVKIRDIQFGKTFEIVNGGIKAASELADPDYPLLSWSSSGSKLAVMYKHKNNLNIRVFSTNNKTTQKKIIPANRIERITGMCFMTDENTIAITGIKKGQSDLFKYTISAKKVEPITFDLFDDKNPVYVQSGVYNGILFLSNRNTNYIGENTKSKDFAPYFNLYLYQPNKGNNLLTLSNTTTGIHSPTQWGLESFSYLTEENQKQVRKIVNIVKRGDQPDTISVVNSIPLKNTLLKQEYIHITANVMEAYIDSGYIVVKETPISEMQKADEIYKEKYPEIDRQEFDSKNIIAVDTFNTIITPFENDTGTVSFLEMVFNQNNKYKNSYQLFESAEVLLKPKVYQTTFYPDYLQTSLDNTLLFTRYQPFDYVGGTYQNPLLSGFLTSTLTDVMEDYQLRAGGRLGIDLNTLDYFLQFNNYRRRVDWGLLYFHHAATYQYNMSRNAPPYYSPFPVKGRLGMDYIQGSVSYPFDVTKSVRLQMGLRYDRLRIKAKDKYSIEIPDDKQYWVVSRAEFVYDNTTNPILNIWKGNRIKFFAEYQYKMNNQTKGFYGFGFDGRNYTTLYKNVILASRMASAFSGGNAKVLYMLGGVDNDFNPKMDNNIYIDLSQNYAFQSLATNMRGYKQGSRNGNSYLVVNEEIRFPIYNTLVKKPVKSSLLKNLQLVLFTDIGSAWRGLLPSSENNQNLIWVQDPNTWVSVLYTKTKYEFGMGYGFGLRTKLVGYFIRTDLAWNIDGGKKPMLHISMATDF